VADHDKGTRDSRAVDGLRSLGNIAGNCRHQTRAVHSRCLKQGRGGIEPIVGLLGVLVECLEEGFRRILVSAAEVVRGTNERQDSAFADLARHRRRVEMQARLLIVRSQQCAKPSYIGPGGLGQEPFNSSPVRGEIRSDKGVISRTAEVSESPTFGPANSAVDDAFLARVRKATPDTVQAQHEEENDNEDVLNLRRKGNDYPFKDTLQAKPFGFPVAFFGFRRGRWSSLGLLVSSRLVLLIRHALLSA
jgi:hypothetical protein